MSGLPAFLLARIAEVQEDATQLAKELDRWQREQAANGPDGSQGSIIASLMLDGAFSPARLLAECEAKRRIVELHTGWHECVGDRHGTRGTVLVAEGYTHENDPTLLLMALPYAEHPDYREEWKP